MKCFKTMCMSLWQREREGQNLCVTHLSPKSKETESLYTYRGTKRTWSDPLPDSSTMQQLSSGEHLFMLSTVAVPLWIKKCATGQGRHQLLIAGVRNLLWNIAVLGPRTICLSGQIFLKKECKRSKSWLGHIAAATFFAFKAFAIFLFR